MTGRSPRRPRPSLARRWSRPVLALVAVLVLAGCQLRTELNVTVDEDGSGEIELAIALDPDAVARRPGLADELDLGDLVDTGWVVTGPAQEADGDTWIRATHAFGTPEELGPLVEEVAGDNGPFQDFRLERADAFASTTYRFRGTVDFSRGLESVTDDPELADALGDEPGDVLAERLGAAIDELVTVKVAARLPGSVESNAPTRASNGAVWQPSVLERDEVDLSATGTIRRTERLVWAGVAAAAGFAFVLYVLISVVRWRRRRRVTEEPVTDPVDTSGSS